MTSPKMAFLHIGDCIAIERGQYSNMRRVSDVLCEGAKPIPVEPTNLIEANQCHEAKEQLLLADTDDEVSKARGKCEAICHHFFRSCRLRL
jgi:hypothetical protein